MTSEHSPSEQVSAFVLNLYGEDPFAHVYEASEEHRQAHGAECEVYPSDPLKIHLLATLVRACGARRILEIGGGLGYSALWLAAAAGAEGRVESIDRFPEHVRLAEGYASEAGLAQRIDFLAGEGRDVLERLAGPYDLIHDDGWFAREPEYFERMVELLRPGGLLALSNWFLLEDAVTGKPRMDWAQFAGPDWAAHIQAYARKLSGEPRLHVSFVLRPWLALAVKLP